MRSRRVAAAALLTMFCGCKSAKEKAVFIDPALELLVPPDTTLAFGADMDAIRTTHVFQKYLGAVKLPRMEEFVRQIGIDPRKDLWQVLSCSNGKTGLFLARGRFSVGDAEPRIEVEGVTRMSYKGFNLFGDERNAVLFLNSSTAAAGRTSDLRTIVDRRNRGDHGLPPALKAKVTAIPATNQVWAVFTGGLGSLNLGVPEESNIGQALRVFRGVEGGAVAINLRQGFGFQAHLDCKTDNDAKHVRDAIKGVIGLGRLSTPDNQPDLLKLYDGIQAENHGTQVDVTAQVSPELEDKFLDLWLSARGSQRR